MDDGYRIVNGLKLPPKKVVKIVRTTANGPKGTVLPEPKVWFFRSEEGEVVGPCAVNGCRGLITRETPIRKEGWPAWKKAYEVPEFAEILVHAKPPASEKWFWALVFSPMLMWILAMVLGENTEPLLCFLVALVSTLLFLHLDGRELKKSGRDDDSGSLLLTLIVGLIYIPIYLFSRGTRYTKKYIPPIIWCVMLVFPMVLAVLGSVFDIEGLINQIDDEIQVNGREEMTCSDLIKEMEWMRSPGRTSAQKQARCDQIEGRKVADDDDHAVATAVVTPSSFCGVEFGENIETRFRDAKLVDRSNDRKLNHGMSYMEATVTLGTPFRNFKKGWVYAAMTSKKVYQVGFSYEFPRGVSTSVDEAECEGVIRALKTKYGVNPSVDEGFRGDKDYQFRLGDVVITLYQVKEGTFDRGKLTLVAENVKLRHEAERESKKYYEQRSRKDLENMKSFEGDGVDAL